MIRIPSIHVDEKQLVLVINKIKDNYNIKKLSSTELAKLLLSYSTSNSCNNRLVSINNNRVEKKTQQILTSSKGDAILLADIIHKHRVKKKHRGITRISQTDKDWPQVKKLVSICLEFCNEFSLDKRKGFIEYTKSGLDKISSPRQLLSKLINMQERIFDEYEIVQLIEDDNNSKETKYIYEFYSNLIAKKTGIPEKNTDPLKYINFLKVREITDELDVPCDIYIKAQFHGLAWTDGYPSPSQLVGDKARERLNKYLYEKKIKLGSNKPKEESNVLMKIKKNGKNRSD